MNFNGLENYAESDVINNVTLTNCEYSNGDFTANYTTGLGDTGILSLKLLE